MASNSNNTNNYNNDKNKVETNSNITLLLQLLSNPANFQQMLASTTQTTSASSAIVGVVNISFSRGSAQNPIMKEEWIQWKKTKKPEEDWKDFLQLPHATYWTYRFKREFPTFPISVGDFVLQKISENILGNWVMETERKKKVKEAYDKGILLPLQRKNITPPSRIKKTASATLSTLLNFQGVLPSTNIISSITNSIEIDSDEAGENIDASSELLETEDDASTELYSSKSSASITRSKKIFVKLSDIVINHQHKHDRVEMILYIGKKKTAKANSKRAAKKQTIKKIGSDENESGDSIDAEFFSSELSETDNDAITKLFVPTTRTKRAIEKLSDIRKKKTAKANSKHVAKKQTIKEIKSDSNEIEDNIDAEFLSSELPEVDDDASTELSVPTTRTKRAIEKAIEKLSDISNQPSTQAQQSGNNSEKKKTAKANSKRATKKQTMKKIESDSGEIENNIDAELLLSELPEVDNDASTELSVPITRSKKTTDSNQPLIQAQQSGNNSEKKRTAKANLKRATKKNKQ
ncbi:hypothetical protein C2G38_2191562 [Gigaspora rosea]|uniref:Uncharacterized protein n=1 Tax=Gigaspora rosea TaxID=44941 RepID=A0A397V367_9GLOM|nr:hypothetical protein C2G38_2191562 [Gigaspora rosea]